MSPTADSALQTASLLRDPSKVELRKWSAALVLFGLISVLYAPVISSLVRQWWEDPNYGHGFFVPAFSAYILWRERSRWMSQTARPRNFGFVIMVLAVSLLILGTLGVELFTERVSLLVLLVGIVLFFRGYEALRSAAFPLGYLAFMIPLPAILYYQLTFPLQLWASRLGATGLIAIGIHTVREGNLLILPHCTLNVVEACSGIRSLLSLVAAVVAYGYLAESRAWIICLLAAASVPVAIVSNGLRLVATGLLTAFWGPSVDSGLIHVMLGLVVFALAFVAVIGIHKALLSMVKPENFIQESPARP